MTILIFEDENLAAEKLKNSLLDINPDFEILGVLRSVESATEWLLQNVAPDLIISDIRLLDGLSFEIFQHVKVNVPVIFTTAYDQYAIRAFEVNSIDYLLKPVQKDKLAQSLQKFRERKGAAPIPYEAVLKMLQTSQSEFKSRYMVRI